MGIVPGQEAASAVKFVEESRRQARRDLKSAKVLLESPDPHLENVAFLLEQSYEKILKAAYVSYKTYAAPDSWEGVYKAIHNHNISFVFEMLRNSHEHYAGLETRIAAQCKQITDKLNGLPNELKKAMDAPDEAKRNIMAEIDKIERNLERSIKRENFVDFVSKLDSNSFKETCAKRDGVLECEDWLDGLEHTMPKEFSPSALDFKNIKKYIVFCYMLLVLAPYTLPHAVASRYPVDECKMKNLEAYRTSPGLKGFFDELACKIQTLLDSESSFTEQIIRIHSKSFLNPDQSA